MYYTQYKGIWYKFVPKSSDSYCNIWSLSDTSDGMGNIANYNADRYRIDQCLEMFKEWYLDILKEKYSFLTNH